ncbi:uncharacterized protein SPAPADRAFT_61870 [Spathaspora passalidarum NRRL Y-27907]|uniref:DUF895 domain membrane protein n=1 Tax=Spathaspora passalidarum (strain NRRL Y-27907 / 11-Y1) TaxID=619300 RepID=G3ARH7_SPAPN|nr:uncharacterized protein SPAPADRAFT_61870 [Spathaspora passalidarum NRRL Y-27907]EGW31298.1 hypothetical protein SPAPADRAFT_61870 [Spathaspora passalidarum NRRL Y-27907]
MDEKSPKIDVNSNSSYDSPSQDLEHQHEHLELKHHTSAEIEADGHWYNKKISFFGTGFRYSSAMTQIVMLAFVVFMTPGMFNALTGIGASIDDKHTADNANVALYSTFATIGFFGGTICNIIGVRASLMLGGTGYALYAGSLLAFNHTRNKGFVIFAGAYLGLCAAVLWAAQGTIIMSYPTESTKGRAIMVFWVIFNLGAVIGSVIPLADNIENKGSAANDGTFIAFIILMCLGSIIAFFMLPMSKVFKSDGTKVMGQKHPYWKDELIGLGKLLLNEPRILLMFPMFFSSNWFYTYQFNNFNYGKFNLRTRSLNSLLYWLAQMVGAVCIGFVLDWQKFRRSIRARIGFVIIFIAGLAIWGGGLKFQLGFTREQAESVPPKFTPLDYTDGGYIGPMFLYIFYGMFDAIFQSYIFWILGALSNNPKKTALYAGFYKGIQSAGAAIAWRLDAIGVSYMALFASSWAMIQVSMLIAAPLIFWYIKDHTSADEDHMDEVVGEEEVTKEFDVQHEEQ